jgi:hypothetical protein
MLPISRAGLFISIAVLPLSAQLFEESSDLKVPLTAQEKAVRTLKLQPGLAAGSVIGAGISQLTDNPHEWGQGMEGYGHRFISSYGQGAIASGIGLGLSLAFKTDPRYDRCECTSVKPRLGHALVRVVWTRKDAGGEMLNVASLGNTFGGAAIANQWRPDRQNTAGYFVRSASTSIAITAGFNVVREFWPEIRKKVPFFKN